LFGHPRGDLLAASGEFRGRQWGGFLAVSGEILLAIDTAEVLAHESLSKDGWAVDYFTYRVTP